MGYKTNEIKAGDEGINCFEWNQRRNEKRERNRGFKMMKCLCFSNFGGKK